MRITYHKSTTDYTGRTVDLLMLQFVAEPGSDIIVHPDVSKSPRIVTGIEKLAQRFALTFLTQIGTVNNSKTEGTDFMGLLGSGHIYDESTLRTAAAAANKSTFNQIRTEDKIHKTADDEAIYSSSVIETSVDRSTATVYVTIEIVSVAGEKYVYTTPLATGV
jgi:hypothetical protein